MTIDILCKVVDNFGDIGVVYRLARSLSELDPELSLRLIVDKLEAFAALEPAVDASLPVQSLHGWRLIRWDSPWEGLREDPPRLVIESFACGRPEWFEEVLFDPGRPELRLIVNLEYLSAEAWVEEIHGMPSLTRSALVKKRVFMPGFTASTGGLILDNHFLRARSSLADPIPRAGAREALLESLGFGTQARELRALAGRFWTTIFSYERDYGRVVADLAAFNAEKRPILALIAAGKSSPCFFAAWEAAGRPFPALALPFLAQEDWDEVLLASDFSIVRGEDSFSRAALSGRPFLWQAYPQEGGHQLVKVRAFLKRLRPFLDAGSFGRIEALHLAFNDRLKDEAGMRGEERLGAVLDAYDEALAGFEAFAAALIKNGNLALPLLTLFRDFV